MELVCTWGFRFQPQTHCNLASGRQKPGKDESALLEKHQCNTVYQLHASLRKQGLDPVQIEDVFRVIEAERKPLFSAFVKVFHRALSVGFLVTPRAQDVMQEGAFSIPISSYFGMSGGPLVLPDQPRRLLGVVCGGMPADSSNVFSSVYHRSFAQSYIKFVLCSLPPKDQVVVTDYVEFMNGKIGAEEEKD